MDKPVQKSPKIIAFVQARMGSQRLPGKVLKNLCGKPMIYWTLKRLSKSNLISEVVLATSQNPENDSLEHAVRELGFSVYRGDENDVLDRYFRAALAFKADVVVRITGDCPLISHKEVDRVIQGLLEKQADYASNVMERTLPRGFDAEAFTFKTLEIMHRQAHSPSAREHVTTYIRQERPELFNIYSVLTPFQHSQYELSVDVQEDFELVERIFSQFPSPIEISLEDTIAFLEKNPDCAGQNMNVVRKNFKSSI